MQEIIADLKAEQEALDRFLSALTEAQWDLPSPAEGWTLKDSVAHIAHIDEVAVSLLQGDLSPLEEAARVKFGFTEIGPKKGRSMKASEVLPWWREVRSVMMAELSKCDPKQRVPWFAMPMGARAFATARLMETWAHGLDCFDAVGAEAEDADRLRHVALLAYMARPYAYQVNGLELPGTPLRIELALPSGKPWAQGPEDAPDRISGRAGEFCRVAVRRRHWRDMSLKIEGNEARRFMEIIQTYAGPPGSGRKPLTP
ncbi:MAG: TIGR03084 family protein [Deltaproteobacteria bacterium]|nr:TIGR03084 family protein [Deltaproteobacteria bacterium]